LSYSHRELPNDPDNPVPARVRASLAAIRENEPAPYPPFLGRTVSDNALLCQLERDLQAGLDIYPQLG